MSVGASSSLFAFKLAKPVEAAATDESWQGSSRAVAGVYCSANGICYCSVRYNGSYMECKLFGCSGGAGRKCDWY